jgi:Tol biopolymer transport system component
MRQLTWRRRSGEKTSVFDKPGVITQVDLSPDGTRAVVVRGGSGLQDRDLWLADFTSGVFSRLTTHPTLESSPAWAADGRRIAYHSSQTGIVAPYVKDLATGKEERVFDPAESVVLDDWTPDGLLVLRTYGLAIFSLSLADRKLRQLADTPYSEDQLQVSPDNRWIAFNSDESETAWEVYAARFPGFTEKRQLSVAGGVQPRWRGDGRELFYLTPDGTMMAVPFNPDGTTSTGAARALFKTSLNPPSFQQSEFDVSADGERFLILEPASTRPQVFTFLLNWMEGPTK